MSDKTRQTAGPPGIPIDVVERVFDLDVTLARLGGNRNLFAKLVHFYFDDTPLLVQQLRDAATQGDVSQVERAAHTLKSLAANFEALHAARAALQIEERAQAGDLGAAVDGIPALEAQLRRLDAALGGYAEDSTSS